MAGTITATTSSRKGKGIVRINASVVVGAGGVVDAAVIGSAYGRIVGILIDPTAGAGGTITSTADVTITDSVTGAPIIADLSAGAAANFYRPTAVITDNAGAAVTAATTAADVNRDIYVAGRMKLAIANATEDQTALICVVVEEG